MVGSKTLEKSELDQGIRIRNKSCRTHNTDLLDAGDPRRPLAGGKRGRVGYINPEGADLPATAAAFETDKYAGKESVKHKVAHAQWETRSLVVVTVLS